RRYGARARSSGRCRSASRPPPRSTDGWRQAVRRWSTRPRLRRPPATRPGDPGPPFTGAHPPPRPASHVRHPPARRGRGPPGGPGAPRSRRSGHDAAIHSRQPRAVASRPRRCTPASLGGRLTGDPAETDRLWAAYKSAGEREVRDALILHYSPLVKYVAGRVAVGLPQNVEQADLVSYG